MCPRSLRSTSAFVKPKCTGVSWVTKSWVGCNGACAEETETAGCVVVNFAVVAAVDTDVDFVGNCVSGVVVSEI